MFGKLFGGKNKQANCAEDQVWMSAAACRAGMCRQIETFMHGGKNVVVVCLSVAACDAMSEALSAHQPAQCRDIFGRDALRTQLARPGSLTVALSGALPAELDVSSDTPVEILVLGRNNMRSADEAIVRFADLLGSRATIAFHLALDDELLKPFANGALKPMLEQLGMSEHEAIAHTMVTRAIKNSQEK